MNKQEFLENIHSIEEKLYSLQKHNNNHIDEIDITLESKDDSLKNAIKEVYREERVMVYINTLIINDLVKSISNLYEYLQKESMNHD